MVRDFLATVTSDMLASTRTNSGTPNRPSTAQLAEASSSMSKTLAAIHAPWWPLAMVAG
jgi:hypothetical protein